MCKGGGTPYLYYVMRFEVGNANNLHAGFEDRLTDDVERLWIFLALYNYDGTKSMIKHNFNDYGRGKSKLLTINMWLK